MNKHLNIVTPAIEFINYRSTSNLLKLLTYLSHQDCNIPQNIIDQLKENANYPIIADIDSVLLFDKRLWSAINKINFSTSWTKLLADEEVKEPISKDVKEPISKDVKERISEFIEALKNEEETNKGISEKFSQPLLFFANINEKLAQEESFTPFIDESKNLGQLLASFIVKEDKEYISSPWLHESAWEWILPSICISYSALLAEIDIVFKDGELDTSISNQANILKKASSESIALFSMLFLIWGSVVDVRNTKKVNKTFHDFFENLTCVDKENPFLGLLRAFTCYECEASDPQSDFILLIEARLQLLQVVFSLTEAQEYLRPKAYEFIFKAILDEKWELEDTVTKELMTDTIDAVLNSWSQLDDIQKTIIKKNNIFIEKIKSEDIKHYIKKCYQPGPSIESALFLINQYNFELQDLNFLRDWLIGWLVDSINNDFNDSGFSRKLSLVEASSLPNNIFILQHPRYWESLSTLPINLVSYDLHDGAIDGSVKKYLTTERLVVGANAILGAGYVDYSLILLGYGLLHGPLNEYSSYEQFSSKQINSFITKPDVWPRVEKYFLPFLNIILALNKDQISFENKLWIESIRKRFQLADLKLIQPISVVETQREAQQIKFPLWFNDSGISIRKSLEDLARILQRINSPNKAQWRQIADQHNLRSKVHEISDTLEGLTKSVFNPIYSQFVMNNEFKLAVNALSDRSFKDQGYLDLGWIDFFISNLQKNAKKSTKAYKDLLVAANSIDQILGKLIYKIGESSEPVIKRFRTYREIRNHLSHGNPMPGLSDSEWLFAYAMSDFDEIFQLAL